VIHYRLMDPSTGQTAFSHQTVNKSLVLPLILGGIIMLGGCGVTLTPVAAGELERRELNHGGLTRRYFVHAPAVHQDAGESSRPLVLVFHGAGGSPETMAALTGFNAVADEAGFVVAYPEGINGNWNDGRPGVNSDADDVGFVRAILDAMSTTDAIDPKHIYATGLSNGGHLSFRLAFEMSDRIAAIAPVAALLSEALAQKGPPARPIPVMITVGDEDPILPYGGGMVGAAWLRRGPVLSAGGTIDFWVRASGASPVASVVMEPDVDTNDGTRVRSETYDSSSVAGTLVFLTVERGGHAWPGGQQYLPTWLIGRTSRDLDLSRHIWRFFAKHRLAGESEPRPKGAAVDERSDSKRGGG